MFLPESLVDLQSLSPVMSSCRTASSSALPAFAHPASSATNHSKKANLNSLLAAGGGRWITDHGIDAYLSDKEEDYSYLNLDSKPELVDRKRQGGNGAGGKKGRRHAGEALLQRKLSRQAYLIKDILTGDGEGEPKQVGKKRRARLLSDHLQDFNVSVPYSLNRKNRWDALDDAAGCLVGSHEIALLSSKDEPIKYSIVESYFKLNKPEQGVKAYREFNMDGQLVTKREATSTRGTTLQHLLPVTNLNAEVQSVLDGRTLHPLTSHDLNVQYRLTKAHPTGKLMGIDFILKGGKSHGRCIKRMSSQLSNSYYSANAHLDDHHQPEEEEESEEQQLMQDENDEDYSAMYRPKKNETYSLADFLKDTQEQPVIVRRNRSMDGFASQEAIENQYNFVLANGVELAESVSRPSLPTNPNTLADLRLNQLRSAKNWTLATLDLPLERYSIDSQEEWERECHLLSQQPHLRCRQLTPTRLQVDLSHGLAGEAQPPQPLLVVVVDWKLGKMVVNASFKCPLQESRLEAIVRLKASGEPGGLTSLLDVVAGVCRPFYQRQVVEQKGLDNHALEPLKNAYNSQLLSTPVLPLHTYAILELNSAKLACCTSPTGPDSQFVLLSPQHSSSQEAVKLEQEDDDLSISDLSDFETIDMEEFGEPVVQLPPTDATPQLDSHNQVKFTEMCDQCGDKPNEAMITMLDGCGHRYCSKCLGQAFLGQLEAGNVPLKCLSPLCDSEVPLELLQLVMPLTLANHFTDLSYLNAEIANGKIVSQCASCHGLASLDHVGEYGQLYCTRCNVHWCVSCRKQPHWPLTCHQANEWLTKFGQQYELDKKRAAAEALVVLGQKVSKPADFEKRNAIAQQFSAVCTESRARRLDTKAVAQLAKNMRRLTSYKTERQFADLRKTALHLLEYGYGWLYMTRGSVTSEEESTASHRPAQWSQVKALLSALRTKVEGLDSEILFSSSLTDTTLLLEKIDAAQAMVTKVIDKFTAESNKQ